MGGSQKKSTRKLLKKGNVDGTKCQSIVAKVTWGNLKKNGTGA